MNRDHGDPPRDLAPEVLFRSLLPRRPSRLLSTRIRGAEHIPLYAVAVPFAEEQSAADSAESTYPELRQSAFGIELARLCIWTAEGPAFSSAEEVGVLDAMTVDALVGELAEALSRICPTFAGSNRKSWREVLERGANHPSNINTSLVIAASVDEAYRRTIYRPDRYWGLPTNELLDGHWMLFHAAREMAERYR